MCRNMDVWDDGFRVVLGEVRVVPNLNLAIIIKPDHVCINREVPTLLVQSLVACQSLAQHVQ